MKLDVKAWVDSPREVPAAAKAAEEMGFDTFWASETSHDPFVLASLAGAETERLSVGTAIALAFPRSPMLTANSAWDLQSLTNGRFTLGLGPQVRAHIVRRFSTEWSPAASRMRDYIGAVRAIWACWQDGGRLSYESNSYNLSLMTPWFSPGPIEHPSIPIYLAAVNKDMLRVAGEIADGVHVHPMHTTRYIREFVLPHIQEGASRAGREASQVELTSMAFVITGRNAEEMADSRRKVRQQIAFYASTPTYRPAVLEPDGWGEVGQQLSKLAREQRWQEMEALVPEEMERAIAVQGAWDEIGPLLTEKYNGLFNRITLYVDFKPGVQDDFWRTLERSFNA
ncbi:MAG: Flavin-dependent oxidoreductase, luciferase family [Chloroflexi bacterium]|nr:MAG: Flavin-dependent oxidoreductase, luciferase family [Chloroflexota bacterium]